MTVNYKIVRNELKKKHERFNVADEYYHLPKEKILEINNKRKIPLNLMCLNVTGEYNISTMIRTAAVFGFKNAFVVGRRRFDNRGLVGANHYIRIHRIAALDKNMKIKADVIDNVCKKFNLAPVIFEIDGTDMREVNWHEHYKKVSSANKEMTIVIGNEWEGFDKEVADVLRSQEMALYVKIPQNGVLRSLNVGCAMSIATWHIVEKMNWIYGDDMLE